MIVYSLQCSEGHAFESWFAAIAAFDEQAATGRLICPFCNSRKIGKAPMAPALTGSVGERRDAVVAPAPAPSSPPGELTKMRHYMTGLRKYIQDNAEYVGRTFPEEARKIHYGEAEDRPIYGEASLADAVELVEEGVDVAALPPDLNEAN